MCHTHAARHQRGVTDGYAIGAFVGLCRQAAEVDRVVPAVLLTGIVGPTGEDVG